MFGSNNFCNVVFFLKNAYTDLHWFPEGGIHKDAHLAAISGKTPEEVSPCVASLPSGRATAAPNKA